MKSKIKESFIKGAYARTIMKMIDKGDPKTMIKCYKILVLLDSMMKDSGLRTSITISSVPYYRKKK